MYFPEDDNNIYQSNITRKTVIARKDRGTTIRKGDTVKVESWFYYEKGGKRTRYVHSRWRVAKGPNWPKEEATEVKGVSIPTHVAILRSILANMD